MTNSLENYYSCLEIGTNQLDKMLESDSKKWETNLKLTKDGLDRMSQQLSSFSAE